MRVQYIHSRFRKKSGIVHAIHYVTGISSLIYIAVVRAEFVRSLSAMARSSLRTTGNGGFRTLNGQPEKCPKPSRCEASVNVRYRGYSEEGDQKPDGFGLRRHSGPIRFLIG
jgi:hypothetical protein